MDRINTQEAGRTGSVLRTPVSAINAEIEKAKRAPEHVGLLAFKPANDWVKEALAAPNPRTYFHGLVVQCENTVIFASSNVGKSILAVQIAEDIAREEQIMYIDLEQSPKQFQMRYSDDSTGEVHIFPANFIRAEIDADHIEGMDLEQEIMDSIEEAANRGIRFFIIDNITYICTSAEKGATAGSFMLKLTGLKKKYSLTTIIIAHTPKRRGFEPITQNDLAGSAILINLFDAGIALARSSKDDNLRYLKQVKVRSGEYIYNSDNVMVLDIVKDHGYLKFEIRGYAKESEHLRMREDCDDSEEIIEILRLQRDGKSIRQIAEALDISKSSVQRKIARAKKDNITIPDGNASAVPTVPAVPHLGQAGHTGQEPEKELPFDKEED